VSSDATSGETESAGDFVQRAQLLAELGRYDEAAAELGFAIALEPDNAEARVVLARVHLAADRPTEALTAADAAATAAPTQASALVAKALALADLRRFGEAAQVADQLLTRWPADDVYAQRSAAAILGEARNGQPALDAAWRAVQLAPEEAEGHLVLGLVAARLELFGLAERAYREALRIDPALAEADQDVGIMRLERRRYARALARLAESAAAEPLPSPAPEPPSKPEPEPVREPEPAPEPELVPEPTPEPEPDRTPAPEPEPAQPAGGDPTRRAIVWSAGYTAVAAVLTGYLAAGNGLLARFFAVVAGVTGLVLAWRFTAAVPGLVEAVLPDLLRKTRLLAVSLCGALVAPTLLLVYAVVGTGWPLLLALAVAGLALLGALSGRRQWPRPRP
jgi:tetratricopeptide (TPR) repeat protein